MRRVLCLPIALGLLVGTLVTLDIGGFRDIEQVNAGAPLQQIAADPSTGSNAQHASTADNHQAAWGDTIVSVYQVARANGCSCGLSMGWATSTNGGTSWTSGIMPNLTSSPLSDGPHHRITDAAVAYDDAHDVWLAVGAAQNTSLTYVAATVSRSANGTTWNTAALPRVEAVITGQPDKTWIACNNMATSPRFGHCYVSYTDRSIGSGSGALRVTMSTDGGATWTTPIGPSANASGYDSVPVGLPNGNVVVVSTSTAFGSNANTTGQIRASVLTDNGSTLSWTTNPTTIASVTTRWVQPMRSQSKPSVTIDPGTGRIFVAWHGCNPSACTRNDPYLTSSLDGVTWTPPAPVDVDPATQIGTVDHFDVGIGFDPRTSGPTGRLGLVYFSLPAASCTSACPVYAGLSISLDGGTTWGRTTTLTPTPTNTNWLVQASQGRFLTDYNSVLFPGTGAGPAPRALTAFPFALAPPTAAGMLSQHMFAISVPVTGPAPAPPTGVAVTASVTAGVGQATVLFTPGADGGINPTFLVRELTPVAGAHTAIGGSSPLVVTGLANNTAYTFEVTASNHAGTSAPVTVTVSVGTPPTPPTTTTTTTAPAATTTTTAPAATTTTTAPAATTTTTTVPPTTAPPSTSTPPPPAPGVPLAASGYWMLGSDGIVYPFGAAGFPGDASLAIGAGFAGGLRAVDLEPTTDRAGYWIVDNRGTVHARGTARADLGHAGLTGAQLAAGEQVTALSSTPTGAGYWIFTNRGRAIAKGDARHFGDMSGTPLNGPVLDSIPTPSGNGYYMVGSDGGIFAFGDAAFLGSMGGQRLNQPVQSLVPTATNRGYWLVASDGGIFAFGDAVFRGSMGSVRLNRPVTGMVRFGNGYLMVGEDGGIFSFSDRAFLGSLGDRVIPNPVTAVAAFG